MKKKIIIAVIDILIVLCVVLGIRAITQGTASKGDKSIEITVVDESDQGKELLKETLDTDAANLTDLLKEKEDLKAVIEDGTYGAYLTSLAGKAQDAEKGPWWVYESDNNEICVKGGMCPAMDEVLIQDGDRFVFKLTASFE